MEEEGKRKVFVTERERGKKSNSALKSLKVESRALLSTRRANVWVILHECNAY